MKVINFKKIYLDNYYIRDNFIRIRNYKHNYLFEKHVNIIKDIDSILHVRDLEVLVEPFKKNTNVYSKACIGSESMHYGHLKMLYDYSGLKMDKPYFIPKIEHGINFSEDTFTASQIMFNNSFVFQGRYKKNNIHRINSLKPVFCIGPFIHYAQNYYSMEQIKNLKRQFGKTLLVFPSHSYEASALSYDIEEFVNYVMNELGKKFTKVLVSAYWLNIDHEVYKMFEKHGATIVSAGARFDPNFIKRLKTMINLADEVVSNDLGTYIGYCHYLKKPLHLFHSNVNKNSKFVNEFLNYNKFSVNYNLFVNNPSPDYEKLLYRKFWGGEDLILSSNEVKNLIYLIKRILKESKGNVTRFDDAVKDIYYKLRNANSNEDSIQFNLLKDAIYEEVCL